MTQPSSMSRRDLFSMIGTVAGASAMYAAMTELGHAEESDYNGPIKLDGDVKGTSVLVLGAGVAGLSAALELRNAGYKVQLLEYQDRPGGRNWSVRGGDVIREINSTQTCQFDPGFYINPGPWRIPYHHYAFIDYCRRLKVGLEPFNQVNHNAYVHNSKLFGGKPQRFRHIKADFNGHVADMMAQAARQGSLDKMITREDREVLVEALRSWGALDRNYQYVKSVQTSERRGFDIDEGGGLAPPPKQSDPMAFHDLLQSRMWSSIASGDSYEVQTTIFQPVGGMGMLSAAFARELGPAILKYNCKITEIRQDASGVTVSYVDPLKGGSVQTAKADWCINCIPASVLSQMPMQIGAPMRAAINAVAPYAANFKAGLQFKRRFWEEDEGIYGGITYTDLPIASIGYPNTQYATTGKGVLLGAYPGGRPGSWELMALSPAERIKRVLEYGAQIHPQYPKEFENGVTVAWHRIPWTMGAYSSWTEEKRAQYYENLCQFDGRMVLAGEHAARGIWQEHAILSGLNAVKRLHQRVRAA